MVVRPFRSSPIICGFLPGALFGADQDRLDLVRGHDDDPAFVGGDEIAWPYRLSAARDRRIDGSFAQLRRAAQRDAASEDGKLVPANGGEVPHGAVDHEADDPLGLCRDREDFSPNAVSGVIRLNDEHVSALRPGDRDVDHEVVSRMAHDRHRQADHAAVARKRPYFGRQDRMRSSFVKVAVSNADSRPASGCPIMALAPLSASS